MRIYYPPRLLNVRAKFTIINPSLLRLLEFSPVRVNRSRATTRSSHLRFRELQGIRELRSLSYRQVLFLAKLFLQRQQLRSRERRSWLSVRLVLSEGASHRAWSGPRQP